MSVVLKSSASPLADTAFERQSRIRVNAWMPKPITMAVRMSAWGSGSAYVPVMEVAPAGITGATALVRPPEVKILSLIHI